MSDFEHILELFRQEAGEHLAALEKGFLDLETAGPVEARQKIIDRVFRHAHGLKGAARAVELLPIQNRAQELEDTLDALREDPETITREAIEQGLAQFDALRNAFEQWAGDSPAAEAGPSLSPVEAEDAFTVRVGSDRLDRLLSLAGELRISQRSAELHAQKLADVHDYLKDLPIGDLPLPGDVLRQLRSQITSWQSALVDQLKRIQGELHNRRVREGLLLEALEGDIREARLLPLSMLAESLRRPVRDLAQSLDRSVRYEVDVGTVLLDKAVIEALRDPLLHMIRNAVHHGIEPPEERGRAGKPEQGRILLRARRSGDRVRVEFSDDGRGVQYERIREHLARTGQLDQTAIAELGERDLASYLFQPGFTTAARADEISGRGVGLDVVHDTVRRLHGSVELESSSSAGAAFVITVPVSISTVRILTVSSGGQYYGIPSSSVVRTARVQPEQLRELEGSLILTVDGDPVPWLMLADLVRPSSGTSFQGGRALPYVLIAHEGKRLAVGVDDTEDESEVILKPLGFPLTGMPGILGGTVRPDGSVQVVLDPAGALFRPRRATRPTPAQPQQRAARILVVDDSPTTRTILRNVLTAAGYSVRTASDGVDALEKLRHHPADLVVSDVQMPRMNGLELTRRVKAQFALPVVLVTGMEQEEQRREGLAAGADAYVVKSTFEGQGLLEVVKQFV
jgi:two-component system chemotaxis sensor kinase CheA